MFSSGFDLNQLLFRAIAFLIAITVHEFAHAFVAYRLGDPTPKQQGRITLNPVAHMDILGTLMILMGPIGWAKPVTFNPYNFRGNKRAGKVLTTLAGPVANLIIAIVFFFLFILLLNIGLDSGVWYDFARNVVNEVVYLNIIFFVFNLVPIPPLDGFWIVNDLLPPKVSAQLHPFMKYGPFVLLLFVFFGLSGWIIIPISNGIIQILLNIAGLA